MATRHFGDQIGGRRRNNNQIGVARQPDMPDVELALRIEQIDIRLFAGERADRERRYEMLRGSRHDAADHNAAILQTANEIERLVGGYPAADDQEDAARAVLFRRRRSRGFGLRVLSRIRLPSPGTGR